MTGKKYLFDRTQTIQAVFALTALIIFACLYFIQLFLTSTTPQPAIPEFVSRSEIIRGDIGKRQVIFTFDAGDSDKSAEQILNTLARHHIQGTFFMTGKFVERYPEVVKKIAAAGHEIFNHTYDHPYLTTLSGEDIVKELNGMSQILASTTGQTTKRYFRAPYGDRDERVLRIAHAAGYQSVYWTVDALDWQESEGETAASVENRILNTLASGNIYLMHVGDSITGNILDDVFTRIESRGYKIVSLTQGL